MITKKNLLYNFLFRASYKKKIGTYYHLLDPLFYTISGYNMFLNLLNPYYENMKYKKLFQFQNLKIHWFLEEYFYYLLY